MKKLNSFETLLYRLKLIDFIELELDLDIDDFRKGLKNIVYESKWQLHRSGSLSYPSQKKFVGIIDKFEFTLRKRITTVFQDGASFPIIYGKFHANNNTTKIEIYIGKRKKFLISFFVCLIVFILGYNGIKSLNGLFVLFLILLFFGFIIPIIYTRHFVKKHKTILENSLKKLFPAINF